MAMNAHAGCPCRRFRAGKQRRIRLKPDRFHPRVILGQYVLRHVVIRRLARNDQIERTCRRVQPSGHARNDKRVHAARVDQRLRRNGRVDLAHAAVQRRDRMRAEPPLVDRQPRALRYALRNKRREKRGQLILSSDGQSLPASRITTSGSRYPVWGRSPLIGKRPHAITYDPFPRRLRPAFRPQGRAHRQSE